MDKDKTNLINWDEFRNFLLLRPVTNIRDILSSWRHATVSLTVIAPPPSPPPNLQHVVDTTGVTVTNVCFQTVLDSHEDNAIHMIYSVMGVIFSCIVLQCLLTHSHAGFFGWVSLIGCRFYDVSAECCFACCASAVTWAVYSQVETSLNTVPIPRYLHYGCI